MTDASSDWSLALALCEVWLLSPGLKALVWSYFLVEPAPVGSSQQH